MSSIFTVREEDIDALSSEDCVRLFGELLHSDARRLKLSISKVHFTTKTVPDGGIDASVEGGVNQEGDLIVDPESFYQIKSGKTFSPWRESEIRDELLHGKDPTMENLGNEVQRCLRLNGTYILVCMKVQLSTEQKTKAEEHLSNIFSSCGVSNPKVKVWGQDKILGAIASYPSLELRLTYRKDLIFKSHAAWSELQGMKPELVLGEKQNKFIKTIQDVLADDSGSVHLNIHGEPGIGKTRLVLEATRNPFLSPLVIYCSSPKEFLLNSFSSRIVEDTNLYCILVIDECDHLNRLEIWDRLSSLGSRLKLVTIFPEYNKSDESTKQMQAPDLGDSQIEKIIQTYHDDPIIASNLSGICNGNPRVAHMIGWDLQNNPSKLLRGSQDAFAFFDRYLNQGEDPSSVSACQRKRILMTLALFKKFGNYQYFANEFKAIHKIVNQIDTTITLPIFSEHIKNLQSGKILQGQDTLYISPKALHLWLWMKWWENYSSSFTFEDLVNGLPPKLREWFFAMFQYSGSSPVTKRVVRELFAQGGPLSRSDSIKTRMGADFFHSLSNADPAAAVDYLERTMGTWPDDELRDFSVGRRSVLDGLERIVFESELFTRGGSLLRSLAENENEDWSNNATGLFTGMFALGPGYVSLTKTPPQKRIPLLKDTLYSENKIRRDLGLKACESALQAVDFLHPFVSDSDELRLEQKGWEPKTYGEWADAYRAVIELMVAKLETFSKADRQRCASIISDKSRGLISAFPFMAGYVVEKLYEIKDFVSKEAILQNIIEILEFEKENLTPETRSRLEQLQTDIVGTDYHSLLKRYVGMGIWLDLAEKERNRAITTHIQKLAEMSLDVKQLEPELPWLVTGDAKCGYVFGQELAKKDAGLALLPMLLEAQRKTGNNGSGFFLSGYLTVVFDNDDKRWAEIMNDISQDPELLRFFSEIAWRSGINDEIGMLVLDLAKSQKIKSDKLGMFTMGGIINMLSEDVVVQWIEYMADTDSQKTVFSAASLFYSYFVHRSEKVLAPQLTLKLLTHNVFMGGAPARIRDMMVDHYWKEIGLKLVRQHPEQALYLSDKILSSMGEESSIISHHSQSLEVLNAVASNRPDAVWEQMTKYISLPYDKRGFAIINWMRGKLRKSNGFLDRVAFEKISAWIDNVPHKLAPYIAAYCKPELSSGSLARKLVVKYGSREDVRRSLAANFSTEMFSGHASVHLQKKKDDLLAYKERDDDSNVKDWIDYYVGMLDKDIKREQLLEERQF